MMQLDPTKIDLFWGIFERTLGRKFNRACQNVESVEEWDSLKHVELIFELEQQFNVEIGSEDIPRLYSNTDVILEYLNNNYRA